MKQDRIKIIVKKSMFLCILFTSHVFFAQNKLVVQLERSSSDYDASFLVNELTIFKDNQIFKKIKSPSSFAFYDTISNGLYSFQYINIFGENVGKSVLIKENENDFKEINVALYVDKLQDSIPKNLFVQKINNGERIVFKFDFSGCFNSGKDSLIISKSKNDLYVLYKRRNRKLKPKEIEYVAEYENELRHLKEASFGSTLNGFNEVIYNSEKLFYVEPSVFWNGYNVLKKRLKLK